VVIRCGEWAGGDRVNGVSRLNLKQSEALLGVRYMMAYRCVGQGRLYAQ
jgi:hypothetical protein